MQPTSPHAPISSKENGVVKHIRSLSEHKHRSQKKAFVVEGVKMVEEALRDNLGVVRIVACPSLVRHHGRGVLKLAESKGTETVWISEKLMDSLAESKTPQPVMAEVAMGRHSVEELLSHPSRLIVLASRLQDPGNLGTIIRTCEAAGASGLVLTAKTVDPYNSKTVRASMGSILRVPVVHIDEPEHFIGRCKQQGFQILAMTLAGAVTHFDVDLKKPTVVIFGQEGSGLPADLVAQADLQVSIPMALPIDSLNVAASAAVVLYEAVRQRRLN